MNFTCGHPTPSKIIPEKKNLKIDFRMSTIKPKLCEWLFLAWTQMCKRKKMICKGWALVEIMSFATIPDVTMCD
jgi:hypothetical protein